MSQYTIRRSGRMAFTATDLRKALQVSHKQTNGVNVRQVFWDAFTYSMFTLLEESYQKRSRGGADTLGNRWPALSISTIKKKGTSTIMIDTGRLLSSLSPGKMAGRKYLPPEEQEVELTPRSLSLSSKVPYAVKASARRPVWPENLQPWVVESVAAGLEAVAQEIAKR